MKQVCKITEPDHWLSTERAAVPLLLLLVVQLLSGREGRVSDISLLELRATARCGVFEQSHLEMSLCASSVKRKLILR